MDDSRPSSPPLQAAPRTGPRREALIIAHGAPKDPMPQEAALKALAVRVAMWLPGWQVRGATLAAPGALEAALSGLHAPLIYPFFMAEGWFTRKALPKRLGAAGAGALCQMPAFGTDAGIPALMLEAALTAASAAGLEPHATTLLIAAHGSKGAPASYEITEKVAQILRQQRSFAHVTTGYIEQPPFLAERAAGLGPAICLPFFALRAGHVAEDLPEALAQAGFTGPLLPAIGENAQVARLIATVLARTLKGTTESA